MKHGNQLTITTTAAALMIMSCTGAAQADGTPLVFTNIAPASGMNLPATLNEEVAFGDYDNDNDEDVFLSVDGQNYLFRNDGGGLFTDVTVETGLDSTSNFSVGAAFGDLDNDGDLDLYVVSFDQDMPDELYRNDGPVGPGGVYVFTDVSVAAGLTELHSSRGITFIDYDRDSLLDIYVNAIIPAGEVVGPDIFYRNLGNLQFESIALDIGMDNANGNGVGVTNTDVNNDNWPDLFTGNRSTETNALYLNNGDGTFTDIAAASGILSLGLGMGVISFDYDNDLDWDLYWTVFPGDGVSNSLYQNQFSDSGAVSFIEVAAASGTEDSGGWGISANIADVDNDGWEDFFVTNGADASSTANVLFRNNGDGSFTDATAAIGGADFDGRGVAFADWDHDGDMDFVLTGGPNDDTQVWRNDSTNDNHWLQLKLEGTQSNRSAIGAKVTVTTDVGTRMQMVSGGAGRGNQNSLTVEFGLGQASQILQAEVLWPSGLVQDITADVALDQWVEVKELTLVAVGSCPGRTTLRVRGATPNSRLTVYSGTDGGSSTVGRGSCAGTTLDLGDNVLFAQLRSNGKGNAFVSKQLSSQFCAQASRFQVVNQSTCSTSSAVAVP